MRSRYCAFVLDDTDYLLQTWDPKSRPPFIEPNEPGTQWLGLKIVKHEQSDQFHATVEFVARVRNPQGRAQRLHEVSRFEKVDGHWFYLDGEFRN